MRRLETIIRVYNTASSCDYFEISFISKSVRHFSFHRECKFCCNFVVVCRYAWVHMPTPCALNRFQDLIRSFEVYLKLLAFWERNFYDNRVRKLLCTDGTKLFKPETICSISIFKATLSNCFSTFLGHKLYF